MRGTILIVEDEASAAFAMEEYFRSLSYAVDCVLDKDEAKRLLAERRYKVVITDLRLSGTGSTEGLEIIDSLRGRARSILLTAFASPEIESQARACGVDVFLQKPQPLSEVAEIVSRLIALQQQP